MKRLFIVLIKYIPIIQMVGMLFNNILYCFSDIYIISYILDFIIGNSITTTFLLQCADFVELVNGMWQKAYDAQKARQDDRNVLNAELFSIYSAMRNGFDAINAKHNEDAFNLYKYSRDSKDELSSEIGELRTELAVLKATRPYQDALIQCDIRRVAEHADFNLWRRTCRMISGEVVLPNTPVIEGYASYNPCHIQSTTPAPAA